MQKYYAGIDIGASSAKAVIINAAGKILGSAIRKSGADLSKSGGVVFEKALESAGLKPSQITLVATTGYGRTNLSFANQTITEITCHARGVYHYFPRAITIIDIGGQDNKVIKLDKDGKVLNFKMNRKCAAGTGAFIEEIAYKMDIPLKDLNALAKKSTKNLQLGSYCTVFTATEILSKIREGEKIENIIHGVFISVVKRIIEMDPLEGEVVLTGGVVAHNDVIITLLSEMTGRKVLVPPEPQLTGALGAALITIKTQDR